MVPKIIYMCHKNLDKIEIYSKNWKKLEKEKQPKKVLKEIVNT
jgi:hypothetical protein